MARLQRSGRNTAWTLQQWRCELQRDNGIVWVVEESERSQPVALLVLWRFFDKIEVVDLVVHPAHRRQGIASAVVAMAIELGKQRGIRRIGLEVRGGNTTARSLYEKLGFDVVDILPGYYDDGEDALVMARRVHRCDTGQKG